MRVLVVGSGGREHALAWGLARSSMAPELVCAPGNPGMATLGRCVPLDVGDASAIAALADDLDAELTVVGPETPLVAGAVDAIEARGRLAFGPRAAAARLEGSKAWMKDVALAAGVPTARHATFRAGQEPDAVAFLDTLPGPWVVKTDGLAAGKGVAVLADLADARDAVREYLSGAAFGDAGTTLVIEEGLTGPELSLLVLCDGSTAVPLEPAQDFKRVGDGDTGPNTGGMGAYSPVPAIDAGTVDRLMDTMVEPTLAELRRRDAEYRGILYAGLMLTAAGPKLIEYNVRFGDPETQVVVPRLASDLLEHCLESARGKLAADVEFRPDAAVTVVLATEGYPTSTRTGDPIAGVAAAEARDGVVVFHAGTARGDDGVLRTAGGRALAVTATAPSIADARTRAYGAASEISWPGLHYRHDIAAAPTS
ncbi:MAG TPA: phosphoribosylamine--glycine ligase [Acidimicrobiia bacterium]|nr:phosphoribosylamine--glycine ligase [Acidimicrobiia bacterium]